VSPRTRRFLPASLILVLLLALLWQVRRPSPPTPVSTTPTSRPPTREAVAQQFLELEARFNAESARDFAPELDAAPWDDAVVRWWENLLHQPDSWTQPATWQQTPIEFTASSQPDIRLPDSPAQFTRHQMNPGRREPSAWLQQLQSLFNQGWRLRRSRWHLIDPPRAGQPHGIVRFELLLERMPDAARASIRGEAVLHEWSDPQSLGARIEIRDLEIISRTGAPLFITEAELDLPIPPHTPFTDPLLSLPQANGSEPELFLPGASVRVRRDAGNWRMEPLPGLPKQRLWAAAIADWNRDGHPDLLLAGSDGLRWIAGPDWVGPGTSLWAAPQPLRHPQVLAVSDIDGDGDSDVFVGQYKLPYVGGQFPTPWHDANDGFPCFLLRNDGPDGLKDITESAGLGQRRFRRLYSASFADWNDDGKPDLIWVSDFAGVDLFQNLGEARFEVRTALLGDSRHLFGMAHVSGDFNGDGHTDLFAIGMDSPVADRLGRLGVHHAGWPQDLQRRRDMTHGNRLWLGNPTGLKEPGWAGQLARGGWAWAVTTGDFDNNGHLDFHLCNGHETRAGVRDYERQFWLQDLHAARSTADPATDVFFRNAAGKRAADAASYGGWQHGALFLGTDEQAHANLGWLAGSAVFADTRNAVSLDFNGDGHLDLAVTTFEEWPRPRQRLILLRNTATSTGHWVGFQFKDRTGLDTRIRIQAGGRTFERRLTTGESHRSQSAGYLHFGLGPTAVIDSAAIRQPGQPWKPLPIPAINQWHLLDPQK
jgi:hypothetical protein